MNDTRPLSMGQESLWLLYKLAPGSAAYNLAGGARMSPAPHVPTLARAVRVLSERHDLLRSVFVEEDDRPSRVVLGPESNQLDVRDVPEADDERLRELTTAVTREPFALTESTPFRAVLLRRRDDAVFLMVTHHIASDATSQWLLWRDLIASYEALHGGREPDLPPVPAGYDDFVAQEARLLDSPTGRRMADYWRDVCLSSSAAELPTDRPRPEWQSFAGASVAQRLPDDLAEQVQAMAARLGVSTFAYLLGTFQGLLFRYTGQSDAIVACPASIRRAPARQTVGYYVNPILVRSRFDRSTTFADAAAAASDQIRQGMARSAYPFPLVARAAGGGPLFRISVTMVASDRFGSTLERAVAGEVMHVGGLKLRYLELPHLEGQCDLTVEFTQDASALLVVFRYDTDLFEPATVRRLLDHFVRLVDAGVADPVARVAGASMIDAAERRRLMELSVGTGG